ncbi:odorant-binding protein-like [Orycteropus afer afer]|uniref:Odorant-binding protein-like n=1 Tax=Orycteropus afer afer TaxID=1230840 RepID=A0A8B7AXA7_ORYAF|nr:odorant-binding protein-like [Orycteropus afer afer]
MKITGNWYSIYVTADNKEKIAEDGPLRAYLRHIDYQDDGQTVSFTFYAKEVLAKTNDISEEDYQKFVKLASENGLPVENIVKSIETGQLTLFFLYYEIHLI